MQVQPYGGTMQLAWGTTSNTRWRKITSFFDSTDRTFFITGLQMEVGSQATPFEHRSFGEELALCQRYYQHLMHKVQLLLLVIISMLYHLQEYTAGYHI